MKVCKLFLLKELLSTCVTGWRFVQPGTHKLVVLISVVFHYWGCVPWYDFNDESCEG